ncbi:hypothetical protein TL16_g07308 [Triparma laevis f. inornata]|uniref:EML-like second beta-propeller domain-containing protein n=1 Tax=Triparma laevis f. inornata TaxID=1714386 RepID=A0A9W7AT56_9STRA|nr:hypothetical protein TL16_g07308 [Triparma laevis f. inornata]
MTKHSSSQDSELVAEVSRNNIYKTFDSLGGSRKLELDKWISIFTRISEYSPTTPSLGSEDLKSLWIECNNGEVDIFVNSLFPPPPSTKELILASKKYGNTESVYKNRIDLCDSGQPSNASYFNFDGEGEGERRIHAPPDTSIPSRINYRYCRTPVSAPSGFNVEDVAKSGRLPVADLELKHVLGFKGDGDSCNLYGVGKKVLYAVAAVVIVFDTETGGQSFFKDHDDDITCLNVFEPDSRAEKNVKTRAASGQMGYSPIFYVWEVEICTQLYKLGGGVFERAVCGVTMSWDGKHVAAVGMDDNHQIGVWNLVGGKDRDTDEIIPKLLTVKDTQAGTPPMLTSVVWCPFSVKVGAKTGNQKRNQTRGASRASNRPSSKVSNRPSSKASNRPTSKTSNMPPPPPSSRQRTAVAPSSISSSTQAFITTGKGKHLKFWRWAPTKENLQPTHPTGPATFQVAKFNNAPLPKILSSCAPISSKDDPTSGDLVAVAGLSSIGQVPSGFIYLFQISTATCMSFLEAHPQSPVYSIAFDASNRELYTGGGDGMLHCFSITPKLSKKSSTDCNPPAAPKQSFLYHPDSLENKATLMCQRKTVHRKRNVYREEDERPEAKAGPKKGGGSCVERDGPTKPKLKHLAFVKSNAASNTETASPAAPLKIAVGFAKGMVYLVDPTKSRAGIESEIRTGHCAHVYGLEAHPVDPTCFVTVGEDGFLCVWDTKTFTAKKRRSLFGPGKSAAFSPSGHHLAIGMFNGVVLVLDYLNEVINVRKSGGLKVLRCISDCEEDIDDLKYSPNGTMLAVGSHDNYIDVYTVQTNYTLLHRFKGHTSYITHLDWSSDSRIIQSNCGAYEILYWDVKNLRQIRSTQDSLEADTDWKTWTCVLGFSVMGIWPPDSDGTDVNSVDVSKERNLCVTADDFGGVNLMRYPAVAKAAAKKVYSGHAAHVMNVRFLKDDDYVISVGGKDRAVLCFKLNKNEHLEDKLAPPKRSLATKWKPQGGWDNGRELEYVGPKHAMTDLFANERNPRAMGWENKQQKDGSYKMVLNEPEKPYGDYRGRYNDHTSSRA